MEQSTLITWKKFLAQPVSAGCRDHIVQFYESEKFLSEGVAHFVGAGITQGEAAVVIARPAHAFGFKQELEALGVAVDSVIASGQLVFLDADATLAEFMSGELPDEFRFTEIIGGLIGRIGKTFPRIRAYGEMVDILREQGNLRGMIALEECWNALSKSYFFALLCGYQMKGFTGESTSDAFDHVCQTHSHVLPAEEFYSLEEADSRNRMIASLQRKAAALEREIEERKQAEEKLQAALVARDEFLSIASHELKTPITSLMLRTQMFRRRMAKNNGQPDPKEMDDLLATTDRQVQRLAELVEDMLDVSRIAHGQLQLDLQEVNMGDVVAEVAERFSEQFAQQKCRCELRLAKAVILSCDRVRVEQVLSNLISNALKYAPGAPVDISLETQGDSILIRVRDHGIGITPDDLQRIFNRFERATPAANVSGLGLGLYISRRIAEAHQGKLWAESQVGSGSTFTFMLPRTLQS